MILLAAGSVTVHGDTVAVEAFALDRTLVTVRDFQRFVEQTGYVTTAEQLGYAMVATEGMEDWAWHSVRGASWRAPWGPDSGIEQGPRHPVVSVSWYDADAYCKHLGKRLPTEAEWEHAMRAGSEGTRFPWGEDPMVDGKLQLNFWQGADHRRNTLEDGYLYTSPVRAYPPNAWGIYDPVGNVWQWTADWFDEEQTRKVTRGGSWWCSPGSCSAYGLHYRGKAKPAAPFPNHGFRCAR